MTEATLAVVGLLTAVALLVTAILALAVKLRKEVREIHVIVNSRMDAMVEWTDQLGEALNDAGVKLPLRGE